MFKKIAFAALASLGALALAGGAAQAEVTVNLNGNVALVCAVTGGQTVKQISLTTTASQPVATLKYTCNSQAGLTRTIASLHNGNLQNGDQTIPYNASHTGDIYGSRSALDFGSTSLAGGMTTSVHGSTQLINGRTGTLSVDVPSLPANLYAGDYTDTVTIGVTAN